MFGRYFGMFIWVLAALIILTIPSQATVTFEFFETAITECGPLGQPSQPVAIMGFTLSNDTETGSYYYPGYPGSPTVTDPDFSFFAFASYASLGIGAPTYIPSDADGHELYPFSMSWNAVNDQLIDVSINFPGNTSTVQFGLSGGFISSDQNFGGCNNTQCTVTGYWKDPNAIPEPASATLLLAGFVGFAGLTLRPRRRFGLWRRE